MPGNGLDPVLERLRQVLKSDHIVAASLSPNTEPAVIGSAGSYHSSAPYRLESLLERRGWPELLNWRVPLQDVSKAALLPSDVLLTRAAESDSSVLSMKVRVGTQMTIAIVAVRRAPRPAFTLNDERVLHRYADWVAEFIAMWCQMYECEQRRIGLERALEQVGLAMIMLDRDGRTVGLNSAAQSLLTAGDGLTAVGDTLSAVVLEDAVRLHSAVGHALVGPMTGARAPVLNIRRKSRRPLIIAVLRVAADPQPGETAIVLQIIEPDRDHDSAIMAACTLFGFTGAEARLAKQLVSGATLAEAATALRIQMPTARTYLKQAFAKSGTNRQAALVQVLLSSLVHTSANTVLTAV